jgi:hypothetical protein
MPPMKTQECLALRKCSVTFHASCEAPYCCAHSRTNSAFVSVRKPEPEAIPSPVSPMYSASPGEPGVCPWRAPRRSWPPAGSAAITQSAAKAACARSAPARRSASSGALKASGALAHSCSSSAKFGSNPTLPPADALRRFARGIRPACQRRRRAASTAAGGGTGRRPGRSRNCSRHMPKVFEPPTRSAGAEHAAWDAMQNYRAAGKPQREWRYGLFNQLSI